MDDTARQLPNLDVHGHELPTPEQGLVEAKRLLARIFRRGERVWLLGTRYDPVTPGWLIDVLRQGGSGRWVQPASVPRTFSSKSVRPSSSVSASNFDE